MPGFSTPSGFLVDASGVFLTDPTGRFYVASDVPIAFVPNPVYWQRVSPTMGTITLDSLGRPVAWATTSTVVAQWGRVRITFGNEDVTYLRDAAAEVLSWSTAEPFGDETAVIRFPQISPFDTLGVGDLASFTPGCNVTLSKVSVDPSTGGEVKTDFWYGLWISEDINADESSAATTFQCVGTLYEADQRVALPSLDPTQLVDVSQRIFSALSGFYVTLQPYRFISPSIPTNYPNAGDYGFGPAVPDPAHYQPILTGFVQDLLALAYIPSTGEQWTVRNNGRQAEFAVKNRTTTHWTVSVGGQGVRVSMTRDLTMRPNAIYGSGLSPQDSAGGGCEWRNPVYPDGTGSSFGAYIAPLYTLPAVEHNTYNAAGATSGTSPSYDPAVLRVERYEAFGKISKANAITSAAAEVARQTSAGSPLAGTVTLHIDPQEGSRWDIKQGQNIRLRGLRGTAGPLLHIAHVEANPKAGTVTLKVDSEARDLPTLGAVLDRRQQNDDLVRRVRPTLNASRLVNDKIQGWDCDSGAGIIPSTSLTARTWSVVRVPAATRGDVVAIDLTATALVEMAVGVFDRAILPAELAGKGSPADADYWSFDNWSDTSGLVQAVGAGDDLGGWYPKAAADPTAVITGRLRSTQGFPFVSQTPPFLWVAMWATGVCNMSGRLYPGPQNL